MAGVKLSLGEVEALCKKAARGAGLPWGLAEEAGFAARWLSAHGFDGAGLLLADLEAGGQTLSLAVALADAPEAGPIPDAAVPLLLAPFAALAARRQPCTLTLPSGCYSFATDGAVSHVSKGGALSLIFGLAVGGQPLPRNTRAAVNEAILQRLTELASRTYAPATEASRLAGAGAGISDND